METRFVFVAAAAVLAGYLVLAHKAALSGVEEEMARLENTVQGPAVDFSVAGESTWIIPRDALVLGEGPVEVYLRNIYGGAPLPEGSEGPLWTVEVFSTVDGEARPRLASLYQQVDEDFQLVNDQRRGSPEHWDTCAMAYLPPRGDLHVRLTVLEPAANLKDSDIQLGAVPAADNAVRGFIGLVRAYQWAVTVLGLALLLFMCWMYWRATARQAQAPLE